MLRSLLFVAAASSVASAQMPAFTPTGIVPGQDAVSVIPAGRPMPRTWTMPALPSLPQARKSSDVSEESQVRIHKGPRIGFTILTGKEAGEAKELGVSAVITQFGWQTERRMFTLPNGVTGLTEHVLLIGGVEQGAFLPSYTMMIGFRGKNGVEFGIGPNLSLSGAAYALSIGRNVEIGTANIPFNFAVVPSADGVRLSFLTGFNVLH